ncbi:kinase-like protein [Gymnopus androsaceus JB14]|uniref:Kinase-like protein n=1 Tax=Gymnopus androsaceus JB14 TaxID=1447944 RepID=A0A6A4I2F6_9AGAR|nr:kinase-like protein [Gymnopus androsaceus JB14]
MRLTQADILETSSSLDAQYQPKFHLEFANPRPWDHPDWSTSSHINILLELLYWEAKLSVEDDFRFQLFRCTRRVARKFEILPASVYLQDLTREGNDPICGGGYADIWKGRIASGEACLKVLRIFATDTPTKQVFKDFSQEVLVWSQLDHPNVLAFLGINVHLFPERYCLVSPWYSHGSVVKYLSMHPEANKTKIINDILKGLKYLHTRNPPVVHGDLKGSNILVSDSGDCCLADFGLAGMMSAFQTLSSLKGNQRGSVRWMAPELFSYTELARPSTYTDMYALGCTILEIITGAPPFSEVKLPDIAISIQVMNGTRPSRPAVGFSDELWRAVTTCWAHPPNDRPNIQAFMRMMECETGRNPPGEDVERRYSPPTLGDFGGSPHNDEPLSIPGQPVGSFSDARSRSRPRAHSQSRHQERLPWCGSQSGQWGRPQEEPLVLGRWDDNDSYFNRPNHYDEEDEEIEEVQLATRHLMSRMDRGHQDVHQASGTDWELLEYFGNMGISRERERARETSGTDWDLLDSFGNMGISEPQHRSRSRQRGHEREQSREREWERGRKPRKSAMKALSPQRASSADEFRQYERLQHKSQERERLATAADGPFRIMHPLDGHAYTDQDCTSRPRDWRPEYALKGEFCDSLSLERRRERSDITEMMDLVRRNPHSLLHRIFSYNPPMQIDFRYPIQSQLQNIIFPHLRRPPTSIDLAQMATEPPTPHMRFFHQRLPWYIDVVSVSASGHRGRMNVGVGMGVVGLTVYEVLEGVWKELQRPITSRDFYNEEMGAVMSAMPSSPYTPHSPFPGGFANPPSLDRAGPQTTARDLVTVAFRARCKAVGQLYGDHPMAEMGQAETGEISKGWAWTGIVRKGGMWELKTRRVA